MPLRFRCGPKAWDHGYRFETKDYDQFQVICVTGGRVWMGMRGQEAAAGPGSLLLLPVGSAFTLACRGSGYRGVAAYASGPVAEMPTGAARLLRQDAAVRQMVGLIEGELTAAQPGSEAVLDGLGCAVCALALRLAATGDAVTPPDAAWWAERVRLRLEHGLGCGRPVSEQLAGLGLTYRQLARHFRAVHGCAIKAWELRRRLDEARRLLAGSGWSVTAVAMELGFPSAQHFATCYRRAFGRAPGLDVGRARATLPRTGG